MVYVCICTLLYITRTLNLFFSFRTRPATRSPLPPEQVPQLHRIHTIMYVCIYVSILEKPSVYPLSVIRIDPNHRRTIVLIYIYVCIILVVPVVSYNFNTCRRLKVIADSIPHWFFLPGVNGIS